MARFWAAADEYGARTPGEGTRGEFATAVAEIATNIIRHAYAGRPEGTYDLRFLLFPGRIEARFHDWGGEFREPVQTRGEPDPMSLEIPEGGYGLLLARAMLDALEYDRSGGCENHWRLVKLIGS